jgi:hypothetical protein
MSRECTSRKAMQDLWGYATDCGLLGARAPDLSRELGFCPTKVGRARLEFSPLSLPANSAVPPL